MAIPINTHTRISCSKIYPNNSPQLSGLLSGLLFRNGTFK
jgi:hypothetical protein